MKALRHLILFAVFSAAIVLLLCVPAEESSHFFIYLAVTKIVGIGCMSVFFVLLKRWYGKGYLDELDRFNLLDDE